MSDYQGKHRRGEWGDFVGRVRDLHDQLGLNEHIGEHRDNSDQALARDLLGSPA